MASIVGVVAAVMRFGNLGYPQALVFDEVFYARGAYSLITIGYEGEWGGENQDFANGDFSQLTSEGDYVVHPNIGKLMIGFGMKLFGPSAYGWRFMAALVGVATVLMIAFIARHLLRSTLWGLVAGLFLAVDGEHVVLSRTALLDIFLTFFVVMAFGLLIVDRHVTWRKIQAAAARQRVELNLGVGSLIPGAGPNTGIRWWRWAALVAFGLAVSVKWNGLYFAAAFLILSVAWDWYDRHKAGYENWFMGGFVRAIPAFFATLIVIPLVYLASWIPWFQADKSWGRHWAEDHPGEGFTWLPDSLNSLVHYHQQMWDFHRGLDSPHNYESSPWGWPLQLRPTAFYFEDVTDVDCGAERCVSAIHAIGHPLLWWVGAAVLLYALWRIFRHRDMLALTVTAGYLAAWVPWLPFAERTIFTFYTVTMAPFLVLMVVWAMKRLAQPARLHGAWWPPGAIICVVFVAAVLVVAGFFAPIWTGEPIPFRYWQLHMWLPSWV
ncbi:phospholipid carrier-dependent glycosyltransferase [Demequina sp. B12]|uniref:dolichyl-phosphate-mannose--protein mannosyltransferase n=1 Tax=Demequina sp. B12 TaxID=2992757 RepID=UPI00237AAB35|nr:phospholipid carrier-dependent glycosyltransferase [Demequina sp. B12]MDE0573752.1 phospholipid carrier-dependent glycosyltransferase [Demequina sp. B12]